MSLDESQLVRWVEPSEKIDSSWVVTLHAAGHDPRELLALCRVASPASALCAVQAPFSRNAFLGSGQPIVPSDDASDRQRPGDAYGGYAWFRHDVDGRPDPVSFGDSLAQIEAVSAELRFPHGDGESAGIYLVGHGDGATLARAAAMFFPELLDGVIAIGGVDVAAVLGSAYDAGTHGSGAIELLDVDDGSVGNVQLATMVTKWFEARPRTLTTGAAPRATRTLTTGAALRATPLALCGRAGAAEESHGIG